MFILVINGMLSVSPLLTLYVLLPMPFMAALIYLINSRVLKQSAGVQQKLSGLSSLAQEFFSGIRVLKSFNRTSFFSRLFSAQSEAYKNETLKLAAYDALFFPVILLLIGLSTTITLYAGGVEVMEGRLNPGVIGEFIIYVNMLTWPVASIGWVSSIIQQAAASQERINEFLHTLPEIENPANGIKAQVRGELTFESVGFTYPDTGIQALEGISFQVKQGMLLGITGSTGSGKSTLASLPGRMYDVSQGRILLDGKDIRDWDLFYLRRHIGFVPQEVVLFSDSIEENIAFGSNGKLTTDEIKEAAKKAGIYENIEDFKEKFETKIGERGVKLSGGQKQRLSIARALVSRAPILIFDDCLSAVDAETEENILNHILEASQGKTTLLISHKIGTLSRCDLIIVLQEGKMVEMGTHQELINQNGYYRKISRLQAERK
jgi:ATP-binding cassette subfamily B protein